MQMLRNSMASILFAVLAVAAVKLCYLMDQVSIVLDDTQSVIAQVGPQMVGASLELRGAAREQRSYYKATGKALAIDIIRAGRLIENADAAIQHIDSGATPILATSAKLLRDTDAALVQTLNDTDAQVSSNGEAMRLTLAAARGNFEQAELLWPPLAKSAVAITRSSENVQEATESIRIALEPLRKPVGRMKLVLNWLLGLVKVNIR
jgi:hypothetical protein